MDFTKDEMPQIYASRSGQEFDPKELFLLALNSSLRNMTGNIAANHSPIASPIQAKVSSPSPSFQGPGIANHLNKVA